MPVATERREARAPRSRPPALQANPAPPSPLPPLEGGGVGVGEGKFSLFLPYAPSSLPLRISGRFVILHPATSGARLRRIIVVSLPPGDIPAIISSRSIEPRIHEPRSSISLAFAYRPSATLPLRCIIIELAPGVQSELRKQPRPKTRRPRWLPASWCRPRAGGGRSAARPCFTLRTSLRFFWPRSLAFKASAAKIHGERASSKH